ncbi:MAG: hypothetical protein AB7V27_09845 [Candidatus Binatia bacterium]
MRGKDYFRMMQELAAPLAKQAYETTCETYAKLSDDEAFRLLAQLWFIEAPVLGNYARNWWNTIPRDPAGKYRDVEMFLSRQLYDEARHGKLYADACVRKGYIQHEEELYTHPYARPVPGWLNFTMWLEHLGSFNFTTLYAGEQMASECLTFPMVLKACMDVIEDPVIRWVFEAQWDEEHFHGTSGRYVITKYCQTAAQQEEASWAAHTTWRLLAEGVGDLAKFVKDGAYVPRPAFAEHPAAATERRAMPRTLDR